MTLAKKYWHPAQERNLIINEIRGKLPTSSSSMRLYFPKKWIADSNSPGGKTLFYTVMPFQLPRVRVKEEENWSQQSNSYYNSKCLSMYTTSVLEKNSLKKSTVTLAQ
jgi:hypothetical protein